MQFDPLPYSQMTSYMGNVSLGGTVESPSIVTPQVPMTPDGYDEEIDYDTVHEMCIRDRLFGVADQIFDPCGSVQQTVFRMYV